MDDKYHIPQSYDNITTSKFPFLIRVNQKLIQLRPAMKKIMIAWRNIGGEVEVEVGL